jgi:GR25 family glycosyltransferase involved in LPS biosynthesis
MNINQTINPTTRTTEKSKKTLIDAISKVLIIAYKEATEQLEIFIEQEGFKTQLLRQNPKPEYQNFSRSYLCLLNHLNAWEIAVQDNQPAIIIEADFVPVQGFGKLPLPFDWQQTDVGISWLYTCAPQIYYISPDGYAEGFSVSTVAYIVTPQSAKYLIELAQEITNTIGATNYSSWDSEIDKFLRKKQLKNYIPWRNYGEHGGLPNPEHQQNKLSKTHRADVLYGQLAFTPMYAAGAKNPQWELFKARLKARCKGIARLLSGRFLRVRVLQGSKTPARLLSFAILRQFSFHL